MARDLTPRPVGARRRAAAGTANRRAVGLPLPDEQRALRERLIEICEETIRPLAAENDRTLTFPRKSLEALAPDGFLGLMLPKEWGGLGQNHVMYAHVTETIARYGDASCAMCYVMHTGAVEALRLRATDHIIEKCLKKVREGLI